MAADGKTVVFGVSDTGIGIAPENLEAIFQEYAQVDSPVQRRVSGTGLGLPLAKGLAELLGGGVYVKSHPGIGSTFYAHIPLEYCGGAGAAGALSSRERPEATVLLIDDEEVSRYLVRQALGSSVASIEADSGVAGLALARSRHPRAILLDLNMPQMSGFEVLRQLKTDPVCRDIPVAVLTGQALTREQLETLNGRVTAVISKEMLSRPEGPERLRVALAGEMESQ